MTIHLKSKEFIDALDGTLSETRSRHVAECERCRGELAQLRRAGGAVRAAGEVPEPSPLFWEYFSARVGAAAEAAVEEVPWWQRGWRPVAAIAGVVVAILLTVSIRPNLGPWRVNRDSAAEDVSLTRPMLTTGYEAARDDESLSFVAAAVPFEDLQQIAQPTNDATDAMVAQLTPEQRDELVRLLKSENRSAE